MKVCFKSLLQHSWYPATLLWISRIRTSTILKHSIFLKLKLFLSIYDLACNSPPYSQQTLLSHAQTCTIRSEWRPPSNRNKEEGAGKVWGRRRDTFVSRLLYSCSSRYEKTHWGCSSILQISPSCLCPSICALWSVVQEKCVLAWTGDKFVPLCLRNIHPKEAIEAIGHPHLEEAFQTGGQRSCHKAVSQNPCLPKSPEFPTTVWDLRNLGGYPGFRGFWSGNLDLELQSGFSTRHRGGGVVFLLWFLNYPNISTNNPQYLRKYYLVKFCAYSTQSAIPPQKIFQLFTKIQIFL